MKANSLVTCLFFVFASMQAQIVSASQSQIVYKCSDARHSLIIRKSESGNLTARYSDSNRSNLNLTCTKVGQHRTIKCSDENYDVFVFEAATTRKMTAEINLKGDFYPDSGYLYSYTCQ